MSGAYFFVGKIVNTHGIRGELKIMPQTDFPEVRFAKGNRLYAFAPNSDEPVPLTVRSARAHKGAYIVAFREYDNINDVLRFKGGSLKVPEEDLLELKEGQYYIHEIVGCEVVSEDGASLGVIKEVLPLAANDVWVAKREGRKDLLIPVIDDVVRDVDIAAKRVTIHVLEGLLD
jgi:16S rRNA processing protein RimM